MSIPSFYLEPANFQVDFEDIRHLREAVFVIEQQIPPDIEFDELDQYCHHFIVRDANYLAIGTGRLSPEGKIGRMAVLQQWRHQGIGRSLLLALLEKARGLGLTTAFANAQISALGFYEKFGFIQEGDTFAEAGIPHRTIRLQLEPLAQIPRAAPRPRETSVEAARIDTLESALSATQLLISQARRQLYIYSRDLEYALYGQNELVEALKQFALGNRNSGVQILLQDPANVRNQQHPLIDLAQRLPSYFIIRSPEQAEDLQYLSAFVANDDDGYLFRLLGDRYEGHWSPNAPARNRQLREEFERVWQRARPCTEFRALGL